MTPTVLHPWAVAGGHRPETWRALEAIRQWGPFTVRDVPCMAATDYSEALADSWYGHDSLIVVEHDIVPTAAALSGLLECLIPVCVVAYRLHPLTTRLSEPVFAHRLQDAGWYRWVTEGEDRADRIGLGLVRFRPRARMRVEPRRFAGVEWVRLDDELSQLLEGQGLTAHVHWPAVRHLHGGDD